MTITSHSDVIPMGSALQSRSDQVISDRMTKFLAEELIPLMAGLWLKSANQLNSNLRGNAMAYGVMLKGFSANEIREAVTLLADKDPDREFAPLPQELKRLCVAAAEPEIKPVKFIASMSSLEMQVCAKCLSGQIAKTQQAVDAELGTMIESIYNQGGEISGNRGFQPLAALIRRSL